MTKAKMWNEVSWDESRTRRDDVIEHIFIADQGPRTWSHGMGDWDRSLEVKIDVGFADGSDRALEAIASVITGEVALQARGRSSEGVVGLAIARALSSLARVFEKS